MFREISRHMLSRSWPIYRAKTFALYCILYNRVHLFHQIDKITYTQDTKLYYNEKVSFLILSDKLIKAKHSSHEKENQFIYDN